jgi:hypothetical protein
MAAASTSTNGYLTSTDWNTFNGKQAAGSYVTVGGALGTPSSGTLTNCTFPTLNQNTTGTAANVTGTVAVANGGTGLITTPANGALDIGNGTGFTRTTLTAGSNVTITNSAGGITIASSGGTGTVTSVSGTGTASGLTLSGTVTTSGNLTLSGTASVAALSTASGSAPSYSARAWVNFNGTGTVAIRASGNVSSITDNGVGDYTVNFTTAMSDADFTSVLSQGTSPVDIIITNTGQTTSTVRITTYRPATGVVIDMAIVCAAIFR